MLVILISSCGDKDQVDPAPEKGTLSNVRFWAYQIDGLDRESAIDSICNSHYDLIVMDQERSLRGSEDHDTRSDVTRIHASTGSSGNKKLVLCYLDIGQAEKYRYYWKDSWLQGQPSWILAPDPDGWNDSYGVKYWDVEWKTIIKGYLNRILEDGYDGVYLDWLQIYEFQPVIDAAAAEQKDRRAELIAFLEEIRTLARTRDSEFLFVAQNAPELAGEEGYLQLFDAISQEDIWFDGSGDPDEGGSAGDQEVDVGDTQFYLDQLALWKQAGKPVLNVEYAQHPDNVAIAYSNGSKNHFITYTTLRGLDKLTLTPPPGY